MNPQSEDINQLKFIADLDGERLDAFLVRSLAKLKGRSFSRSKIQKYINDGFVLVDGQSRKKNYTLKKGEDIDIKIPPDKSIKIEGQPIDFEIIYEDSDIVIVNKPAGVITHPTESTTRETLVNGLIEKGIQLAPAGGEYRPGVVHRLDKETSGILVFTKTDNAYFRMVEIFKNREIDKQYRSIVIGNMRDLKGSFDMNIGRHPTNRSKMAVVKKGGKEAKTDYEVLERFQGFDSLRLRLYTGRTHQIRVHLSYSGRSVLNDKIYGGRNITDHIRSLGMSGFQAEQISLLLDAVKPVVLGYPGMFLHAERLVFKHPVTGKPIDETAEIPETYGKLLEILRDLAK